MNIKSMLMRLQDVLGSNHLWQEMVLLPGTKTPTDTENSAHATIDLLVGYNGSPKSHTALDLTLWIAHQTRLITPKPVIVHVVYVVEPRAQVHTDSLMGDRTPHGHGESLASQGQFSLATLTKPAPDPLTILQQADHLAKEWAGSLEIHLRMGAIAHELRQLVEDRNGVLLFLGCGNAKHSIVQQLGSEFPCPVLGIPNRLHGVFD